VTTREGRRGIATTAAQLSAAGVDKSEKIFKLHPELPNNPSVRVALARKWRLG